MAKERRRAEGETPLAGGTVVIRGDSARPGGVGRVGTADVYGF